jgi:PTS system nitrogen regulatory IIA component
VKNIASYIAREDIVIGLDVFSKKQLFDSVDQHMFLEHDLPKGGALHLRNRERIGSTGLGHGVAIPHARVMSLRNVQFGYFRLKVPLG